MTMREGGWSFVGMICLRGTSWRRGFVDATSRGGSVVFVRIQVKAEKLESGQDEPAPLTIYPMGYV
jgi:hypothetical protein